MYRRWAVLLAVLALAASDARADTVADFYRGKLIKVVVGFASVRGDAPATSIREARRPGGPPLALAGSASGAPGNDVPMILRDTHRAQCQGRPIRASHLSLSPLDPAMATPERTRAASDRRSIPCRR